MSWNYRIVQTRGGFELGEVYYDERGEPYAWGEAAVWGDTPEEVQEILDRMVQGAAKPIIDKWKTSPDNAGPEIAT